MALSLPYLGEHCEQVIISAQGFVNHFYQLCVEVCSYLHTLFCHLLVKTKKDWSVKELSTDIQIVYGEEQWYLETILDVPGTDDRYNVRYDNVDQVLSLNLLLDIEQGYMEFVD